MSHLGDRLTALVDGQLDLDAQQRAFAHLRHCADCRAAYEHELWVKQQMRVLPGAEPSAALLMALQQLGDRPLGERGPEDVSLPPPGSVAYPRQGQQPPWSGAATHWRLPTVRRTAVALFGVGTLAAGFLGIAYVAGGGTPGQQVDPPVQQFSAEFANSDNPVPFTDPASDVLPVLASTSGSGFDRGQR